MSSSESEKEPEIEIIFQVEEQSSGEEPPMSEWSSLEILVEVQNKKQLLYSQDLYSPGSGEICAKYIPQSDSDVFRHLYYNYPPVHDPGIKEAILSSDKPVNYGDDGQDLYLALCAEMNICPVRLFHRGLITEEINISYYGVNPTGIRPMAMALQYNKYVKNFNLTDNFLNDDASYHLGQMLSSNVTLNELNLAGCRIGSTGVLRLGESLHVNKTLNRLNLARNNIGEQGGLYFVDQIHRVATVKRVNLSKNGLGRQTALAFTEVFPFKNIMTHLDLSCNNFFHVPTTAKMLEALSDSTVLQELNIAWNALEGEKIAEAIQNILLIPTLVMLDLSNNRLQGEAIQILLGNLIKAKKLNTLDLSYNPLSPEDALNALMKMLRPRVKLEKLLMTNVWVDKKFISVLNKVKAMKCRINFVVTFDGVLENWTIKGEDAREMILRRADYLGNLNKKHKVDVALFFLALNKERKSPVPVKDMIDIVSAANVPIDEGLVAELAVVFPGPKSAKTKLINLQSICEYIARMWPDKKLPLTPPPEPEPEPIPVPVPGPEKREKDKKGKKEKQ